MAKMVGWNQLKQKDRDRVKAGSIYPYDTPGYGVSCFLYPVDSDGTMLNKDRTLKPGCKQRTTKRGGSTRLSKRYRRR